MENLNQIIKQFPEVGEVKEVKALTSGLINQTYLVKTVDPQEADYVLQRINHQIFTDIDMLQHNIEVVTGHIRKKTGSTERNRHRPQSAPFPSGYRWKDLLL